MIDINRIIRRFLLSIVLGILGKVLGSSCGILLLVIMVTVSLVPHSPASSSGPETSASPNIGQTQQFMGTKNEAVVNAARSLAQYLFACGNDRRYKCYTESFPSNVLQYLYDACANPACPYAQSGNFQCVFFVLGAYYLAGQPLPAGPNAVDFWTTYQNLSGWLAIPANGAPRPGDIAVFSGPRSGPNANPFGHVAIVIDVAEPAEGGTVGYIQLAQANGLQAVENVPLLKVSSSLWRVQAWPGYRLLGYIRNAAHG
jgi:hypothetical protein